MFTEIKNSSQFENVIRNDGNLVVANFYNPMCGHCRAIAPFFSEVLPNKYGNVVFLDVDVSKNRDIAKKYGISGTPTFIFFKEGAIVKNFAGADRDKLEKTITEFNSVRRNTKGPLSPRSYSRYNCGEEVCPLYARNNQLRRNTHNFDDEDYITRRVLNTQNRSGIRY